MKIIKLAVVKATPQILTYLERKKLIRTLKPPQRILVSQAANGAMETIYRSHSRWGAHKLICVKKNSASVKLNFHPDNEEFILINNNKAGFRPLCIVIGLLKYKELAEKLKRNNLSENDFVALGFPRNGFQSCVFTMLKDTVHCEVAMPGKGQGPVFFVAEPSRLKLNVFKTKGYKLEMV